ncbi:MAG: carbohydrate binding family 9 domain-containing protein [Gemmatimonadetes bacterium]|nr:carbohydrate binding family 9 domain-containing protein [Gemmatimonadota bacterium]MYG86742.1 carbohydrate binding family 9 domain-containing protein [Gemmatimonadota bacterium]MYJ88491.1 carbohydrate binding family 9 domain-containing protein [Gemmatimonadota bacterium]
MLLKSLVPPIFASIALSILPAGTVIAQSDAGNPTVPAMEAAQRTGQISIDGRLDEAAWAAAVPATRFVQREPVEGAEPGEDTEVRVLYDDGAIYIGARMYDDHPDQIGRQLVRRDERGAFDLFSVSVDPNNDRLTGYQFRVSAAGAQRDAYLYDDVRQDDAWDAVWESGVSIDDQGWVAEMRIPLSQIRYEPKNEPQTWGINFMRRRLAANESIDFALQSRQRHGRVSVLGRLNGLVLPSGASRLEIRPYVLGSARTAQAEQGNPFFDGSDFSGRGGFGLRYGLSPSYHLILTVNPDFGQVEVDPAVINLSAFETFFREQRPFFVLDAQEFEFGLSGRDELYYSRRIGRQPRGGTPDDADFADIPTETSILGAAKITGRSPGGVSIGALAAVTGRESGKAHSISDGRIREFTVEPRAEFGVFRIRKDYRNGASQVGAVGSLVHRALPDDGAFDYLTSEAFSGGVDFEHNWGGARSRDWAVYGYLAGSRVQGSPEALTRIQRSSNHYFQRPDATRLAVDSTATSMNGYNWRLQFARRDAEHWTGAVWFAEITPGFEVNDLGFSRSNARLDGGARIEYQNITPGRFFRNYDISFFTFYNFRHEALDDPWTWSSWRNNYKNGRFWAGADFELNNNWDVFLGSSYAPTQFSDTRTRGGPVMEDPGSYSFDIGIGTDGRKRISLETELDYENYQRGGHEWGAEVEATIRPTPNWELEVSPNFSWERNAAQYVTRTDALPFAPTYGSRYVFSDLERRSFSLETRLNVAFSPDLTLQLYAQPLLSSGDYLNYKQLLRGNSFDFDVLDEGTRSFIDPTDGYRYLDFDGDGMPDINFSDRDFNIQSLRMNVVLRWEYRPGSRVFLVWQQTRSERDENGALDIGRDFGNLFGGESENIFIVKFNYWFGV